MRGGGGVRIRGLTLGSGTSLDTSASTAVITITDATLRGGSFVNDPGARIVHTNPWSAPDGLNSVNYVRGGATSVQFS